MRSTESFGILIMPKLNQEKNGIAPLYVRITVNKKRIYLSLKRKVEVNKWDQSQGKLKGQSAASQQLNDYLNKINHRLLEVHQELILEGRILTAESFKARYLGEDDTFKRISDILNYHKTHMKRVLKPGTLKNYVTTERYLYQFIKTKYKAPDFYLKQLNYQFVTEFENYLRSMLNKNGIAALSNNGVMKHLERFKKLVNLAHKLEWIEKEPFAKFALHFERVERDYLNNEELESLLKFKSIRITLTQTRDIFLFACYTGLAWIDVRNLTADNIVKGIDGSNWIFTAREKTDTLVKIPILKMAQQILDKYACSEKVGDYLLPVYSNQKTNKYLKEIASELKIDKNLTFHVARHTFATTVTLSNGVPIETVSKLLGHTKIATTQVYARVLESKISADINILRGKIETDVAIRIKSS